MAAFLTLTHLYGNTSIKTKKQKQNTVFISEFLLHINMFDREFISQYIPIRIKINRENYVNF